MGQKSLLQTGRGSEQFLFPVSLEALLMATFGLFQEYMTQRSWGKKTTVAEIHRGTRLVGICVLWGVGGILMSIIFLVKEWKQKGFPQPYGIFVISFQIRGRWIYH